MKTVLILIAFGLLSFAKNNPCAKEGEAWRPFIAGSGYVTCCPGLKGTSEWRSTQKTKSCVNSPPGDRGYCVKCGDGKCDRAHYEDDCICPQDCKTTSQGKIPTH